MGNLEFPINLQLPVIIKCRSMTFKSIKKLKLNGQNITKTIAGDES